MIPRYSRPEMAAIWSPETRFRIWFEIEAHAADAMADLGIVPKAAAKKIWEKGKDAKFDVARIDEIERETKHDVIAFLTHLAEICLLYTSDAADERSSVDLGGRRIIKKKKKIFFFFFQAEDGIRDAQESRGLGDVYKRQARDQARRHRLPDPPRGD